MFQTTTIPPLKARAVSTTCGDAHLQQRHDAFEGVSSVGALLIEREAVYNLGTGLLRERVTEPVKQVKVCLLYTSPSPRD